MMEEFVEINLDTFGNRVADKTDKIALIDADTVAYTACLSTEVEIEIEGEAMYEIDLNLAKMKAMDKIQKILDLTGCADYELHFTTGRDNFRYKVYEGYKANRLGLRSPVGLNDLKKMLCEDCKGFMHTEWEADDVVVFLKKKHSDKYTLCAVDKDVYNSVAGWHFNYYESSLYNIDMKWVETTADTAKVWPYLQCITGDSTDGIKGVPGLGAAKAKKFIDASMTEEQLWNGVQNAFASKGLTKAIALSTMNAVNMHLLQEDEHGNLKIVLFN